MGFDFNNTKFVLFAKSLGADFSSTITLGRQFLFVHEKELRYLLKGFSYDITDAELSKIYNDASFEDGKYPFVEHLLHYLGAGTADSLDMSEYEGATVIHDMNLPIDQALWSRYSLVIDGGTLEHIFNVPTSLQNCMNLLKLGGHFVSVAPANNWLAHGMYQFGPDLFCKAFNTSNGFRMKRMFFCDVNSRKYWYEPLKPDEMVNLATSSEVYLMTIAEKISEPATIRADPQQTYYADRLWAGEEEVSQKKQSVVPIGRIKNALPIELVNILIPLRARLKASMTRPYSDHRLRRFDAFAQR